jgi:predicted transcriptional regulator
MSDDRKAQYLRKDIRDFGIRWGLKWPSDVPRTGTIGKPRIRGVKATLVAVDEAEVSQ